MLVGFTVAGPVQDALWLEGVSLAPLDAAPQLRLENTLWVILADGVEHLLILVTILGGKGAPAGEYHEWVGVAGGKAGRQRNVRQESNIRGC